MHIEILRLGHRLPRDERISTHVALVARAFGASAITYCGQHDAGLEDSVKRICARWGGKTGDGSGFSIQYEKSPFPMIKAKKKAGFFVIHLTMYGLPIQAKIAEAKKQINEEKGGKVLIVVGSEAVPGEVYQLADLNLAVTGQPHSEVAALAITLDRLVDGRELEGPLGGFGFEGEIHVEPSERGKKVVGKVIPDDADTES